MAKLDSVHKDPKKSLDILKVYGLEKERVRTKKVYDATILDLTSHCEDVNERLNFDFLEMLIADINAERLAYQAMAGLFGEMTGYLDDLSGWCEEEKALFAQHVQERTSQRNAMHEQMKLDDIRAFAMQFDKPLVDIVRPIARNGENAVDILPPIMAVFNHLKLPFPEGLDTSTPASSYDTAVEQLRLAIKTHFDAIGLALGSANLSDRITSLSEALAGVEPFHLNPLTQSAGTNSTSAASSSAS